MGVKNKNYVCLAVRDENYLNKMEPRGDWSYHDYRNSNIINYLEAADELTKRGYYVLRMGKNNKIKFETNNPMIIDYSFSKYRSDFMDILETVLFVFQLDLVLTQYPMYLEGQLDMFMHL